MTDETSLSADVAFDQIKVFENLLRPLYAEAAVRAFWAMPSFRTRFEHLVCAQQDVLGGLADWAYEAFPDDPRRWDAAEVLLTLQPGAAAPADAELMAAWSPRKLELEAAVLAAPDASPNAVEAALTHAWSQSLERLKSTQDKAAALAKFDNLQGRFAAIKPGAPLPGRWMVNLVAALEELGMIAEVRARLNLLAASENDPELQTFARGRLRVLEALETPLDLALETIDGRALNLADLRGQVVLLQFWASWCRPCREEIPHLRAAYSAHKKAGFEIIGVSLDRLQDDETLDQARARVADFMKTNEMDWTTHFDGSFWDSPLSRQFGIRAIPASLLLDRDGRVVAINPRGDDITTKVGELLAPVEASQAPAR